MISSGYSGATRVGRRGGSNTAAQRPVYAPPPGKQPKFDQIIDADNLIAAFQQCRARGGDAAGPDQVRYSDLGPREVAAIMRSVAGSLANGSYQPAIARSVNIPKPTGGYRKLAVANIVSRVVEYAVYQALQPVFEPTFHEGSYGFRPGRNVWTLLVVIERAAQNGLYWIGTDDVQKAFDYVPLAYVKQLFYERIENHQTQALVTQILDAGRQGAIRGIAQGGSLSPLALNTLLHHVLDYPLATAESSNNRIWLRYADNLLAVGRTVNEAGTMLGRAKTALEGHGMTLKGADGPPRDIRREPASILGHRVTVDGKKQVRWAIPENAWDNLEENLRNTHPHNRTIQAAKERIQGWVNAYGPCLDGRRERTVNRVIHIAQKTGFHDISKTLVEEAANRGLKAWHRTRHYAGG